MHANDIIDFHCHALKRSVDHLVDRENVVTSVIHPAFDDFDDLESYHDFAREVIQDHGGRILAFIGIDFSKDPINIREDFEHVNASGIKIHPILQDIPVNKKEFMKPFMDVIEGLDVPVYVHTDHPGVPIYNKYRPLLKSRFGRFAKHFPSCKLVMGHAGNNDSYLLAKEVLELRNNTLVETSLLPVPSELEKISTRVENGNNRILFGSNEPYSSFQVELKKIEILSLSKNEKRAILHDNARRLLKL
ncbi:amidohydrolase family protein [Candidatus Bathyarchaeota archaeon]|nr:amidohydrolase family protein [Candidatus Bathyarchaeota archaeon]